MKNQTVLELTPNEFSEAAGRYFVMTKVVPNSYTHVKWENHKDYHEGKASKIRLVFYNEELETSVPPLITEKKEVGGEDDGRKLNVE